jgi:hypothetical protein
VKLDKVSIADLKARHADAAADVGRGILLTALSAKVADMLVEGREAGPHRLAEPACLAAVQAMPWHHSSVRRLIEPVTGILTVGLTSKPATAGPAEAWPSRRRVLNEEDSSGRRCRGDRPVLRGLREHNRGYGRAQCIRIERHGRRFDHRGRRERRP